jgi:hypothetical protein
MKKGYFLVLILLLGTLTSCIKHSGNKTMYVFFKSSTGIKKDIGTAD